MASVRRHVLLTAGLGALTAALVIAQAILVAAALAPVVTRAADWPDVVPSVALLALVVLARVVTTAVQERFAHRAATRAVAELREQLVVRAVHLGPRWLSSPEGAGIATLATRGLDALEPYFVRYLPQLLLAVTVTPGTLAVILGLDWVAAVTITVTLPLVPVFMVLVGRLTQGYAERRLATMQRLGHQVLDLLAGLPTLRALGRERGPGARVRELGDAHRRATMSTLRVAFLSGMVLELLTTLSVALVAVGVGFRLVYGQLELSTALVVLILAPEVYLPLRQVGAHFHASADGVAAAQRVFAVLEQAVPVPGTLPCPDLRETTVRLRGVSVLAPDRGVRAPDALDLTLVPGRVLAVTGENGAGKSTAIAVLLALLTPDAGSVELVSVEGTIHRLDDVDPETWWSQIAWVPQRPVLEPGTVRDIVDHGRDLAPDVLDRAAALTGLDRVLDELPDGWGTRIGQGGFGLSLGQRHRLALARALVGDAALVVLDEPTAHLDAESEALVLRSVRELRATGRTVVLVAHRPALLEAADEVVTVRSSAVDLGAGR